jgi:zinc protease
MLGWLAMCLLAGCAAGPRPAGPSRTVSAPSREVLANGMRLIVQEHGAAEVVALQLWVGVGARDEAPPERGFSHMVEHMLFKGTETRGPGFMDQEIEAVGGRTNAATSHDYTFYHMLLPASGATRGIEILADMAFKAAFDAREIEREREVVFEEMRLGEDNPRSVLARRLHELGFEGRPYGFPVLGDPVALKNATRAALLDYYARHYVPENMTLVVVGPVERAGLRAVVTRAFGAAPRAGYVRPRSAPASALDGPRHRVVERPERQASLGLAWSAPELGHPDMFALDLLARILGGTRSSRLNQALRERARIVSAIGADYSARSQGGLFTITAELEPADDKRVEEAILTEIRRVQEEGVTPEELARSVTALESQREFSRETAEGLARAYGWAETVWSLPAELAYLEGIRAVTRERIWEAARQYLAGPYSRLALMPSRKQS